MAMKREITPDFHAQIPRMERRVSNPRKRFDRTSELDIGARDAIARIVRSEHELHGGVHVEDLGVMIPLLGFEREPHEEAHRLSMVLETKLLSQRVLAVRPTRKLPERSFDLGRRKCMACHEASMTAFPFTFRASC